MMDLGAVLSVAQTLQSSELREICSIIGYKSELDNLERIVDTVKAVLLEAKDAKELSDQAQFFIEELKDGVYEADDLLDKLVTLAKCNHKKLLKDGATTFEKVGRLCSRIKELVAAYRMSQGVKDIRQKLDDIADNRNKIGFKLDSPPIRKRRKETCFYVYAQDIIGRDAERDEIVDMLLDPNVRRDVSFLTIVGVGGLGKTSLVRLVYNDESEGERITKEFPTRLWVCVGDADRDHLNVKAVMAKIMESITGCKHDDSTLDLLQCKVRELLVEKKYLLVLDDLWNENRKDWLGLEKCFKGGLGGSWVVVTTRSSNAAKVVGDGFLYDLKGLSDEDSWNLFERVAFGQIKGQAHPPELVEIGKKIVKQCANVPLAIRVVGSLLYGQDRDKWLSFEKNELAEVSPKENNILPILKFSYHLLDSPLKRCFSYCTLFPKDYRITKEQLIRLWMAQGFIVPFEKDQSLEDAGEEYFMTSLRRCFFQYVEKDKADEITSFKLHDLSHDLALGVSKKEICAVDCITDDLDKNIRHLSVAKHMGTIESFTKSTVRTLLHFCWEMERLSVGTLADNWMSLRALDLSNLKILSLPDQIGNLLHLRYLDLSGNQEMKVLPKSFTKLHNLEILILKSCCSLRKLPYNICKLVKLRCLETWGCDGITHMPVGMDKLTCLHKLTMFAVDLSYPNCGDVLEGLKVLKKVKGSLQIRMKGCRNATYEKGNSGDGGYLRNKEHLNQIYFDFDFDFDFEGAGIGKGCEEALMEDMQPHHKLKSLGLRWYKGEKLPSWARGDNLAASLPNLVEIELRRCDELKYLAPLGKLGQLRSLIVKDLRKLEYMEEEEEEEERTKSSDTGVEAVVEKESLFFPSLKVLELERLPRLKGWWREVEDDVADDDETEDSTSSSREIMMRDDDEDDDMGVKDDVQDEEDNSSRRSNSGRRQPQVSPLFPHLSRLVVHECPELALIFTVPNLEQVELFNVNEKLRVAEADREGEREGGLICSSSSNNNKKYTSCLACIKGTQSDYCVPHGKQIQSQFETCGMNAQTGNELCYVHDDYGSETVECSESGKPSVPGGVEVEASARELAQDQAALLYCCLFPKDHEFDKDLLTHLWVAGGLIKEEPLECIASQYFENLLVSGYIQSSRLDLETGNMLYKTNRNNVSNLLSRGSHVMIDRNSNFSDLSTEISHVSVLCGSQINITTLDGLKKFQQLRALLFLNGHKSSFKQVPRDLFLSLSQLQVLDMSRTHIVEVPNSIARMKCLHYLDLSLTPINRLPETIDHLNNLQTLKLKGCSNLSMLPKGMRKLVNLRHLTCDVLHQLRSMPKGVGSLTKLQTLSAFLVGRESDTGIGQLRNLNNLAGSFCISRLDNVLTREEAIEACLYSKSQLKKLELRWSDSGDGEDIEQEKVLSSLQPNSSLEELLIVSYGGFELPSWICDPGFSSLVSLTIFKCKNCQVLPSLGQLPALKYLNIFEFDKLKVINHNFNGGVGIKGYIAFPKLEDLTIENMFSLEKWTGIRNSDFPCLHSLTLKCCPKLHSLFTFSILCSLEKVEITDCEMLASCLDGILPASVETFIIERCSLISARFYEDGGQDWTKVAHIPNIWVDDQKISGQRSL